VVGKIGQDGPRGLVGPRIAGPIRFHECPIVSGNGEFRGIIPEAIVYDYVALELTFTIIRVVSFLVAATFWTLYFHEILFRSGRVRTQWLRKGLADLGLILVIGVVSSLLFFLLSGIHPGHRR
jgi:hypothetical protein